MFLKDHFGKNILLLICLSLFLTACSPKEVTLEIPEFLFIDEYGEDITIESLKDEFNIKDAYIKKDNNIVLKMSRKDYEGELFRKKSRINKEIEYLIEDDSIYSIKKIVCGDDYKNIDLLVDLEEVKASPELMVHIGHMLGMSSYSYQVYSNVTRGVDINFIDRDSQDILESMRFPDDFRILLGMDE